MRRPKIRLKHRWRKFMRLLRYTYLRILRVRGTPSNIARGLGVGVFAGMLPMFGLQTIIALFLAVLVRGNKVLAVLGTWVSNPLTDVPIHLFNFQLGRWILRSEQTFVAIHSWQDLVNQGAKVVVIWLTGGITMGLLTGSISYLLGFKLADYIKHQQQQRRRRRQMRILRGDA
jgi:uncharacterized protein